VQRLAYVFVVMSTVTALICSTVHASAAAKTQDQASQSAGQVIYSRIPSPTLGALRTTAIYLPPGYADPANRSRRYPVLYLLSGAPGSAKDWFRHGKAASAADTLIAEGAITPLIMVSPDGNGGAQRDTQFIDSFNGRERVETFLTRDVIAYIDSRYRTIPIALGRALAGFSAGGYGALNIGLHHPNLYGTLAGYSGYYTADQSLVTRPKLNNPFGGNPTVLRYNSPSVTAVTIRPVQAPRILLIDSTVDAHFTHYAVSFDAELRRLGITHTTVLYEPETAWQRRAWPHSWWFVRYAFAQTLPIIAATFTAGVR